jgi:hypothetical protein
VEDSTVEFLKMAAEHGLMGLLVAFLVWFLTRRVDSRLEYLEKMATSQLAATEKQNVILLQQNSLLMTMGQANGVKFPKMEGE